MLRNIKKPSTNSSMNHKQTRRQTDIWIATKNPEK
jgi:hypothetical protein